MKNIVNGRIMEILNNGRGQAFLCASSKIQIIDLNDMKVIKRIGNGQWYHHIALNDGGNLIAAKALPGKIHVYDIEKGCKIFSRKLIEEFERQGGSELFFSPDDKYIINGDWEGNLYLIDWINDDVQIIKRFPDGIERIEFDRTNTAYMFYIRKLGIVQWKYPFDSNEAKIIPYERINNTYKKLEWDFGLNNISYCPQKKVFATGIMEEGSVVSGLCIGIFNNNFTSLVKKGVCA